MSEPAANCPKMVALLPIDIDHSRRRRLAVDVTQEDQASMNSENSPMKAIMNTVTRIAGRVATSW